MRSRVEGFELGWVREDSIGLDTLYWVIIDGPPYGLGMGGGDPFRPR